MPVLNNQRHEAFAQHLAKGMNASDAYERAGYKSHRSNASRLITDDNIKRRVDELRETVTERIIDQTVISREWVLGELHSIAVKHKSETPSAANKALELIGKELGMFIDRSENLNFNYGISEEPVTADDWTDQYTKTN